MSPALITMGPLTAYSTAFTCGFKVAMVSVFSRILTGSPVSTVASAVLNRFKPYCSVGPCVLNLTCCHKDAQSGAVRRGTRGDRCSVSNVSCVKRCMFPPIPSDGSLMDTTAPFYTVSRCESRERASEWKPHEYNRFPADSLPGPWRHSDTGTLRREL